MYLESDIRYFLLLFVSSMYEMGIKGRSTYRVTGPLRGNVREPSKMVDGTHILREELVVPPTALSGGSVQIFTYK